VAEMREDYAFLSQNAKAIIQQDESILHLDREQKKTGIQLLKSPKFELKNASIGRFQEAP
jgi:hypothetical protein